MSRLTRRQFLQVSAGAVLALPLRKQELSVRAITRGPKHHWFGYYDKLQFDPTGRYVLSMEVNFEGRSPRAEDIIRVGMIDLQDRDRWIELGESHAWNWQQGCMLQWVPGSPSEVIWNDRQDGRFVSHVLDVRAGTRRTLPHPIYTLSPDGKTALTVDFERIQDTRPGYGYAGIIDRNRDVKAPADQGIYRMDLLTGEKRLIVSIADLARIPKPDEDFGDAKHWFNHLLFNTDGTRFLWLHRWRSDATLVRYKNVGGWGTRMLTADPDGENIHVMDDYGYTSHFVWRDPRHVIAWTRLREQGDGFFLFEDRTPNVMQVGKGIMTKNGHCTYLPGNRWILNDTYPDADRLQHVYLFDTQTGRRVDLGSFLSPKEYSGEWRVDTHPRSSRDGRLVTIDSTHDGNGRQLYLIDIGNIFP